MQIKTERLTLVACPPQVAEASGAGKRQIESILGVHIDPTWLEEDARGLLSYYAYQLREDATVVGWGIWLIIVDAQRLVIGSAGYKGKPDKRGSIEIGYGISPEFRRQGYTFEAVRGLIEWAFGQPNVVCVTAECLPDNNGSKRILEKVGMTNHGLQGMYLKWSLEKHAYFAIQSGAG
ncbi:MAG: GNAT family N-acetyltransferase [Chloroflexi bacterium]|nr:GNAT family N-acetyltransferase [Chloroflexota bacterium]